MENIISHTQKSTMPQRSIFDVHYNIDAIIQYCGHKKIPGVLVMIDNLKAFDRVNHGFLFSILRRVGLGPGTLNLIKHMYTNIVSYVDINGKMSNAINICRGIRQGCPLSMLLYTINVEPLARSVNMNTNIVGVKLGKYEHKLDQYADDITFSVTNPNSIPAIFKELKHFELATGQKINMAKTQILCITKDSHNTISNSPFKDFIMDTTKILGIYFGKNNIQKTRQESISKFTRTLNYVKSRHLTWYGKLIVINSIIMSVILYHARTIPFPPASIKEIQSLIFKFLWHPAKIEAIARTKLQLPWNNGGINMVNVQAKIRSCQVEKMKSLVAIDKPTQFWQLYALYSLGSKINQINPKLYTNSMPHSLLVSPQWQQTFDIFRQINFTNDQWTSSKHKHLYAQLMKNNQDPNPIDCNWEEVHAKTRVLQGKVTNAERVCSYRIVRNGYIFGDKMRGMSLRYDNNGRLKIMNCKFCKAPTDNTRHIFLHCPKISSYISDTNDIANSICSSPIRITKSEIFQNNYSGPNQIAVTKLFLILKTTIIRLKIKLDIENRYMETLDNTVLDQLIKKYMDFLTQMELKFGGLQGLGIIPNWKNILNGYLIG